MLDYIHLYLNDHDASKLLKHPKLYEEFNIVIGKNTSEIKSSNVKAEWRCIKFVIKRGRLIDISGSIHKHAHNGKGDRDFSFEKMSNTIMAFCKTFNINPYNCKIRSFEFGVNIKSNPSIFIDPIVIHKTKAPDINNYKGFGKMKEFAHRNYSYRLYDKAKKEGINGHLLRVENKIKKMAKVKVVGISTLADLLDLNKWHLLKEYLINPINQMIFSEEITKGFDSDVFYLEGKTVQYWQNLIAKDRQLFRNNKKKYRRLTIKYGSNYQDKLIKLVSSKCNELLNTNQANLQKIDLFLTKHR